MSFISENYYKILEKIPKTVCLVAVSKMHPKEKIQELYDKDCRIFGESRPQELKEKYEALPKDIQWHMIGNLQKNKVKYIAPFVACIHSVDSLALLKVIEKEGRKNDRKISCLLEIKVATEDSKHGMSMEDAQSLLESQEYASMQYVNICGIMGMATYTNDKTIIKNEFSQLKNYFELLKNNYFPQNNQFKEISMGMSSDYEIAISEGSTMVRVGSSIFGSR